MCNEHGWLIVNAAGRRGCAAMNRRTSPRSRGWRSDNGVINRQPTLAVAAFIVHVALDTARNSRNRAHHRPRVNRSVLWLSTTQPVRGGVDAHILLERPPQPTLNRKQKGRSHRATARAAQRVASAAYACRMVAVPRCVSQATEPPWSGPGLASRRCTHPSRFSHA